MLLLRQSTTRLALAVLAFLLLGGGAVRAARAPAAAAAAPLGGQSGQVVQPCSEISPEPPGCEVTIMTDRSLYSIGDPMNACYTVSAPVAVTLTDIEADGTSQTVFSGNAGGSGACLDGMVTPPAGTECVQIVANSQGHTAFDVTCFQVFSGAVAAVQQCGSIGTQGPRVVNGSVQQAAQCVTQAAASCTPATLMVVDNGVDTRVQQTFDLQGASGNCAITASHLPIGRGPQVLPAMPMDATCAGVQATPNGLLFSACGALGDVSVPAS